MAMVQWGRFFLSAAAVLALGACSNAEEGVPGPIVAVDASSDQAAAYRGNGGGGQDANSGGQGGNGGLAQNGGGSGFGGQFGGAGVGGQLAGSGGAPPVGGAGAAGGPDASSDGFTDVVSDAAASDEPNSACAAVDSKGLFSTCAACPSNCDTISTSSGSRKICGCQSTADCPCGLRCDCYAIAAGINTCGVCVR
jgi:hypothetical protein